MVGFNRKVGIAAPTTSMGLPTFAGLGVQKPALPAQGIAAPPPFQETWTAKRDREAAQQKTAGVQPAPFQETWVAKRDREQATGTVPAAAGIATMPTPQTTLTPSPLTTTPSASAFASSLDGTAPVDKETPGLASGGFVRKIASLGDKLDSILGLGAKKNVTEAVPAQQTSAQAQPQQTNTVQEQAVTDVRSRRSQENEILNGMAKGGITGLIPGQVDPTVADDITINAKKGEYIIPQEVTSYLGEKYLTNLVARVRKAIGAPQGTGPKSPDQPDNMGRMDKPGIKGIADISGMAQGGLLNTIKKSIADSNSELERNTGNTGAYAIPPVKPGPQPVVAEQTATQYDLGSGQPIDATPAPAADNTFQNKILTNMGLSTIPDQPQGIASLPKTAAEIAADKEARIMSSRTVPTNAGITADMVQLPSSAAAPPKIAPGMESIAQQTVNAGLPVAGSSIGTSKSGPVVMLDGNKGIGDTTAISNRVDWSPGSANVNRIADTSKYNEQVQQAKRHEAAMNAPKSLDQQLLSITSNNTTWGLPPAQQAAIAQGNFNAQQKSISDDKDLAAKKIVADSHLAGTGITAGAHVKAAEITALGKEAAAIAAHSQDKAKESQKAHKELSNKYFDQFSKLNLPNDVSGRIAEISSDYAAAADPSNPLGLFFGKGGKSQGGFMADKALVQAGLNRFLTSGYNLDDPTQYDKALSAVYGELSRQGKTKQVPNMYAFVDKATMDKNNLNAASLLQ